MTSAERGVVQRTWPEAVVVSVIWATVGHHFQAVMQLIYVLRMPIRRRNNLILANTTTIARC